jgi:hypothetical protein
MMKPYKTLLMNMSNTDGFGDRNYVFLLHRYKHMSLVAQPLLHPSMVYASFTILLQRTKHK